MASPRIRGTVVVVSALAAVATLRPPTAWAEAPSPGLISSRIELRDLPSRGRRRWVERQVPFLFGERLDDAAMYRLIGRDDLARAYESRARRRSELGFAGILMMVGGALAIAAAPEHQACTTPSSCHTEVSGPLAVAGFATFFLSPVMFTWMLLTDVDPVSPDEKARLVDDYNVSVAPARCVVPAPAALPGGGGISLTGTF